MATNDVQQAVPVQAVPAATAVVAPGNLSRIDGPDGLYVMGAPPGGQWMEKNHCGMTTSFVFFFFQLIYFCPLDTQMVYRDPKGKYWLPNGVWGWAPDSDSEDSD